MTQENFAATLVYWIITREQVRKRKEAGLPKPWSLDEVFQTTYFCNVNRENDPVTKFIRQNLRNVEGLQLEMNTVLSRFVNWPPSLQRISPWFFDPIIPGFGALQDHIESMAQAGKFWGNAYIITTHGQRIGKPAYLCADVLPKALRAFEGGDWAAAVRGVGPRCGAASEALMRVEGIGSFLAGQIIADLKNSPQHPLYHAPDRLEYVVPGPGSARGMSWFFHGNESYKGSYANKHVFLEGIKKIENYVAPKIYPIIVDRQDLQNCLCEFDKYCRVYNGTGRSKRQYPGKAET